MVRKQLELLKVHHKKLVKNYRQMKDEKHHDISTRAEVIKLIEKLKDEKQHDIANQTNSVCVIHVTVFL